MISAPVLVLLLIVAICWIAAIYDIKTLTIPNYFPIIIIGIFLLLAPFVLGHWTDFAYQSLSFVLAFTGAFVLYMFGPMGGGDVKLFAALGFWVTLPNLLPWVLCVTISGLLVTLIFMSIKMASVRASTGAGMAEAYGRVRRMEFPYGPAIALGTTLLFLLPS